VLGLFEHCWFIHSFVHSDIDVLQGSVATRVRCGGIYNNNFIADIIGNMTLNFFENRLRFDKVMSPVSVSLFMGHVQISTLNGLQRTVGVGYF